MIGALSGSFTRGKLPDGLRREFAIRRVGLGTSLYGASDAAFRRVTSVRIWLA
jgi:hypothetical protein